MKKLLWIVIVLLLLGSCSSIPQKINTEVQPQLARVVPIEGLDDNSMVTVSLGALRNAIVIDAAYTLLLERRNAEATVSNKIIGMYNQNVVNWWMTLGVSVLAGIGVGAIGTLILVY